ncbi:hypothetical protein LWI28_011236 [Acer negundo]|uniref:Uncharacterized protein n=1 Tax=Acer negundo TaxID=4023 RepID=A0AAD5IJ16_ACENE|nr:hypothetical protein LWI28_011236 [Acer negundo]
MAVLQKFSTTPHLTSFGSGSKTMTTSSHQLHIAMFPWLAFGHIIPYLELAKLIAQRGHKITFISTPRNIDRLPKLEDPNINFVKLTLPHQDNLPENSEATSDIPYDKVQYLKKAFDGLQDPLSHLLQISSPDWIIYDFAPHWLPPIAAKLGISKVLFFIFPSWAICFLGSSSSAMINGDDQLATRGCFELESDWLKLLGELHQKPVTPLGLLPPQVNQNDNTTIEWLGEQSRGSVLYVALGSELTLSQEEITELALGNIDRLPKLADPNINFVKHTLPHQDKLSENAEATSDIPYDKVQYLKKAFDGLQDPVSSFANFVS